MSKSNSTVKQYIINTVNARQSVKEMAAQGRYSLICEVLRDDAGAIASASVMTITKVKGTENVFTIRMAYIGHTGERASAYVGRISVFNGRMAWYGKPIVGLPAQALSALKFFTSKLANAYMSWHWHEQNGATFSAVKQFVKVSLAKTPASGDIDTDNVPEYEFGF